MLASFSFEREVPYEVYSALFREVVESGVSEADLDFTLEAIDMAMKEGITNDFSLRGYVNNARKKERMALNRQSKYSVNICSEVDADSDSVEAKGVCESTLSDGTDYYEDLILEDELHYTLIKLKSMYDDILIEYRLDILGCLAQAMKGIPQAINQLKGVCEANVQISEIVYVILSSHRSFEELMQLYESLKGERKCYQERM